MQRFTVLRSVEIVQKIRRKFANLIIVAVIAFKIAHYKTYVIAESTIKSIFDFILSSTSVIYYLPIYF